MRHLVDLRSVIPRQAGHTTAVCEAAKRSGGIVVVGNQAMVEYAKRDFPDVEVIALSGLDRMYGVRKPYLFDTTAVQEVQQWTRREGEQSLEELQKRVSFFQDLVSVWMTKAEKSDRIYNREVENRDMVIDKATRLQKQVNRLKKKIANAK